MTGLDTYPSTAQLGWMVSSREKNMSMSSNSLASKLTRCIKLVGSPSRDYSGRLVLMAPDWRLDLYTARYLLSCLNLNLVAGQLNESVAPDTAAP